MAVFYVLQPRARKQLRDQIIFHDCSENPRSPTAEIQIVFDNEDSRLPVDSNEVTVKWIMGSKKDCIFINGKSSTPENWYNILKVAGLTRNNYFAIQQGETQRLALTSPRDRLKLLQEFAGVSIYDVKMNLALKLNDDSHKKLDDSNEMFAKLSLEAEKLEEQSGDLAEFKNLDRKRQSLQYVMTCREMTDTEKKLEKAKEKTKDSDLDTLVNNLREEEEVKKRLEMEMKKTNFTVETKKKEKFTLVDELNAQIAQLHSLDAEIETRYEQAEEIEETRKRVKQTKSKLGFRFKSDAQG